MREKNPTPVNKIHNLELESLQSIINSLTTLLEEETIDAVKIKQLSDDVQELLSIFVILYGFYTRLLKSYEDLD